MTLDQACFDTCTSGCNTSDPEDPSLFRRSWYSLANSTVLYTVWSAYTCLFVVASALFFWSRKIQPIKSRSPDLVLLSGFGGYLLATNYAFAHYVTGIQRWPCPFSHWSLWLAFPLFLFPFPFRSLRLYLVFKRNVDKVKNHKLLQAKTTHRVTVVEQRFSMSMNANNGGPGSDIQRAIENHKAKKTKQKEKQAQKTPAIHETVEQGHSPEEDADVQEVVEPSSGLGRFLKSLTGVFRKKDEQKRPPNNRQSVRLAEVQAAESGIINTQTNRSLLEQYVFHIFTGVIVLCFIIGIARQFVPALGLGPECVGCLVSLSSAIVQTIIVFIVLGVQVLAAVFIQANNIKDQFKIGRELQLMSVVWFVLLFPACILALRGTECEELRTGLTSCSTFDNFTKFCYYNFAAQHWLIVGCVIITFLITICVPVVVTYAKGRKKLINEPRKALYPNFKALTSLKDCLADKDASEAFQKFCVQSFCVELILFWKDAEQYRLVSDGNELRVRAIALYKRYIDSGGHLFVQLPEEIQVDLDNILSEAASREDEEADFDYNFQVVNTVFLPAQMEVFRQMETDTFPSFLRSDAARKLFNTFSTQAASINALQEQRLL